MSRIILLPVRSRDAAQDGRAFETGRRTRWSLTAKVGHLDEGGSVTLVVESSPTGQDGTWDVLHDFGVLSTTGETTVRGYAGSKGPADFSFPVTDLYLRGRLTAITGTGNVAGLEAVGRFLDPDLDTDRALLSQELRSWKDGMDRVVAQAEADITGLLVNAKDRSGDLWATTNHPEFYDQVRLWIVRQAEHLYRRERLALSRESGAQDQLHKLPAMVPGAEAAMRVFRGPERSYWRGR